MKKILFILLLAPFLTFGQQQSLGGGVKEISSGVVDPVSAPLAGEPLIYHNLVTGQLFTYSTNASSWETSKVADNVADDAEKTALAGTLTATDEGRLVYQEDTNVYYFWDGTAFQEFGKAPIDNLTSTDATSPLSANMGRALLDSIQLRENTVIADNLISTSTTEALSANQGRALLDSIQAIETYADSTVVFEDTIIQSYRNGVVINQDTVRTPKTEWVHISATDIGGSASKTYAELETYINGLTDINNKVYYYTQTDVATDIPIWIIEVDNTGTLRIIDNADKDYSKAFIEQSTGGLQPAGGVVSIDLDDGLNQHISFANGEGALKINAILNKNLSDRWTFSTLAIPTTSDTLIFESACNVYYPTKADGTQQAVDTIIIPVNRQVAFRFENVAEIGGSQRSVMVWSSMQLPQLVPDSGFPVDTTGFAALISPTVGINATGDTIVVKEASAAQSINVDASAGEFIYSFPESNIGDGIDIIYFTNIDVTNAAKGGAFTGQTVSGVDTFFFSSHPKETQFRADEVVGGWVISEVGAGTSLDKPFARLELEFNSAIAQGFANPAAMTVSIGTSQVVPSLIPLTRVRDSRGGMTTSLSSSADWNDGDIANQSVSTNTGSSITVPKTGKYIVRYNMPNVVDSSIDGGDDPLLVISVNGTEHHYTPHSGGLPLAGDLLLDLSAGDRIQMGFVVFNLDNVEGVELAPTIDETDPNLPNTQNLVYGVLEVELFSKTETVLAGMVEPTTLSSISVSSTATGTLVGTTTYLGQEVIDLDIALSSRGGLSLSANNTVILEPGTYSVFMSASRTTAGTNNSGDRATLYDFTTGTPLINGIELDDPSVTSGTATNVYQVFGSTEQEFTVTQTTEVAMVWNGEAAALFIPLNSTNSNASGGRTWYSIKQVPTSTVVMPDAVPVEDISTVGVFDNQVAAVFDGYEFRFSSVTKEFEMRVTAGTTTITGVASYIEGAANGSQPRSVTLDQTWRPVWTDSSLDLDVAGNSQRLYWSDGTNSYGFHGILGNLFNDNFIEIKRLNQKTVINQNSAEVVQDPSFDDTATDKVLSIAAMGKQFLGDGTEAYYDLPGTNIRVVWGLATGQSAETFPGGGFANTNFRLVMTISQSVGTNQHATISTPTKSATGFTPRVTLSTNGTAPATFNGQINYIAIGPKP